MNKKDDDNMNVLNAVGSMGEDLNKIIEQTFATPTEEKETCRTCKKTDEE